MRVLISYMRDCDECLPEIMRSLRSHGCIVTARERSRLNQKEIDEQDFIMVLAGDGTFLKTSHFVKDQPMVGINATPHRRVGFYCRATPSNVVSKFLAWRAKKLKPTPLLRLASSIRHNGKTLKPFLTLNELYVGCVQPYHVSKYVLRTGSVKEYQKTSGLLISTPSGSHAWTLTSGGKRLPLTSRNIQVVSREPVQSAILQMKHTNMVLPATSRITVTSDMEDGIVAIDSFPKPWPFTRGDTLTVWASKQPLYLIE